MKRLKKDCHGCKWLEWIDAEATDPSGFTCNKRLDGSETLKFETYLLKKLQDEKYRQHPKRCCELK